MLGRVDVWSKKKSGIVCDYGQCDTEFERERAWLLESLQGENNVQRPAHFEKTYESTVECACCFDSIQSVRGFFS